MAEEKITRIKLYELIWSEPRFSIAKKFNITDADLVLICKQLKVPLPKPGHWQRKRFNSESAPLPLPEYSGEEEIILSSRSISEVVESPIQVLQRQIENDVKVNLTVPKKLATLDKLILRAKASLEERKKSNWTNNGLISTGRDELEINVSPQNVERALRFMDTLLKAFYARGHKIEMDYHGSNVTIQGQLINFSLIEKSKRTIIEKDKWRTQQLEPTGKLAFRIKKNFDLKEFIDGKIPLESQLAKIIAELEIHGEELRLEKIEREKSWAKQKIEQEKRERYMRLREKELKDFKGLLIEATRWRQAEVLRNYINAVESQAPADPSSKEERKKWVEWARRKADWYDPTVESDDILLTGVDRDNI